MVEAIYTCTIQTFRFHFQCLVFVRERKLLEEMYIRNFVIRGRGEVVESFLKYVKDK